MKITTKIVTMGPTTYVNLSKHMREWLDVKPGDELEWEDTSDRGLTLRKKKQQPKEQTTIDSYNK